MILKEKMFIVASNIDDSIKAVTPVYDITIYHNFFDFQEFIEATPIVINSIIISETDLPFTSSNMSKLIELLASPFLQLRGHCIYLINNSTNKDVVDGFIEENDISNVIIYQGDLSASYISTIVSGEGRTADEAETEVEHWRIKASDYAANEAIKKYQSDDDGFITDEEQLAGIPSLPEPEIQIPSTDILSSMYYVVGKQSYERAVFTFIEAQYLALSGKTLLIESDIKYHRMTDIVLKSSVQFEYFDMQDLFDNVSDMMLKIKSATSRLVFIGCKDRLEYDYNFIYDLIISNLLGWIDFFVRECDFKDTPYGSYYTIVCADNVPDILECCQSLRYEIDENKVMMIGVRTNAPTAVNVTSKEMSDIVNTVMDTQNIQTQVVEANGINLKGDKVIYDVFSIIGRGNERQG